MHTIYELVVCIRTNCIHNTTTLASSTYIHHVCVLSVSPCNERRAHPKLGGLSLTMKASLPPLELAYSSDSGHVKYRCTILIFCIE